MKQNIISFKMNEKRKEILALATTWKNLAVINLSETSERSK